MLERHTSILHQTETLFCIELLVESEETGKASIENLFHCWIFVDNPLGTSNEKQQTLLFKCSQSKVLPYSPCAKKLQIL